MIKTSEQINELVTALAKAQGQMEPASKDTTNNHFKNKYDFAITEIDSTNLRSLNAHKRIGFKTIHQFTDASQTNWVIVLWDWNNLEG